MDEAQRRLYQRWTVWQSDLGQARYFACHLLKKGWHYDPWDRRIRSSTYLQQAAFTTALVAAYCRPFVETRSGSVFPVSQVGFNVEERALHGRLRGLRNAVYAHTDVELHRVQPLRIGDFATAIVSQPILKLSKRELDGLVPIDRLIAEMRDALQSMAPLLEEAEE